MTIQQAIQRLQAMDKKLGNTLVYFDCPKCGVSFTPNRLVSLAAHFTGGEAERAE